MLNFQDLQFATSAFSRHATLGTIQVINSLVSTISHPFIAKICDLAGRPTAYAGSLLFYVVGFTIIAASHTVNDVGAGQPPPNLFAV
jgi:uncharacterized membrane protein YczE